MAQVSKQIIERCRHADGSFLAIEGRVFRTFQAVSVSVHGVSGNSGRIMCTAPTQADATLIADALNAKFAGEIADTRAFIAEALREAAR
jgi:hypothetical protein